MKTTPVTKDDLLRSVIAVPPLAWLACQPGYAAGEAKFAETSASGDLGYTYGAYTLKGDQPARGFYVRVWTRGRDGVWRVALDVLQPQV